MPANWAPGAGPLPEGAPGWNRTTEVRVCRRTGQLSCVPEIKIDNTGYYQCSTS